MKPWILAGCVWLLIAGSAQAQPSQGMRGAPRWWENPEVKQAVGLSEEQVRRIRQIMRSHREAMIDLRSAMEKKGIRLRDEVERQDYDLQRAFGAADEFQKVRREVEAARMRLLLELRGVLSLEQFFKLRELQNQARKQRWGAQRQQGQGGPQR